MKKLFILLGCCSLQVAHAQVVINGGGKIKIDGGTASAPAYFVLNNSPANPIITSSANDGIITEAEYNCVQYNLGTNTTPVTIPFMSLYLEQIPLTLTPIAAGTGTGNVRFSSVAAPVRSTGFDNSAYMPSDVTNMGAMGIANNSDKTIDRFWIIDANGYTTKPAVTIDFTYLDAEWAVNGGNTITEALLQAQRFNNTINDWGGIADYLPAGAINTTANTVSGVNVPSAHFYRSWTLNANNAVLPLGLLYFNATKTGQTSAMVNWAAVHENENGSYTLYKSYDAQNWSELATLPVKPNAGTTQVYEFPDDGLKPGNNYYQLKQIDADGTYTYSEIAVVEGEKDQSSILYPNPNNGSFFLTNAEGAQVTVYNALGEKIPVQINGTHFSIDGSPGIYFIEVKNSKGSSTIIKMVKE